jgi:hypothetical protein
VSRAEDYMESRRIRGTAVAVPARMKSYRLLILGLLSACSTRAVHTGAGFDMATGGSADLSSTADLTAAPTLAWRKQTSGTTQNLNGLWGSSASDLYAVGAGGAILHSRGDGQWSAQSSGTTMTLSAVWGSSAQDLYVVGAQTVLRSTGDGQWHSETAPGNAYEAVWGSGAGDVYIAGILGIAHSTGDGSWVAQSPSQLARGYFGLGGRSASDVWAVGGDGQTTVGQLIGGAERFNGNWSWTALGSTENMKSIVFTAAGTFIVGNGGQIWCDGGGGFVQQPSNDLNDLNSVWADSTGTLFAVGGSGSVVTSSGDGNWTGEATPSALPLNAVWGASTVDVYAVGYAGEILHRSWEAN